MGDERLRLDVAGVRARLVAGTLDGTDVVIDGAATTSVAAHPAFRAFFMPGHADALPPRTVAAGAPAAPPSAGRGRRVLLLVGVGGVLAAALVAVFAALPDAGEGAVRRPIPPIGASVAPAVEVIPGPDVLPAGSPESAPPPVEAAPVGPIEALAQRVGPVEEPRAALLAAAWEARLLATTKGAEDAIVAAERAVARAPSDPEALALLAEVYADAGREPELRTALLARAVATAEAAPAVRRAVAVEALAQLDYAGARLSADTCLRTHPTDLGCREVMGRALESGAAVLKEAEASNLLYALDELAAAWPENKDLPRRGALLAARSDLLGAEARLAVERKRMPKDPALLAASALLAFRDGSTVKARGILETLDPAPDALLVEAAGEAVGRGAAEEALGYLARLQAKPTGRDARLYEVQARWLLARAGKAPVAEATAAGERAAQLDGGHPAVVQARVAIAGLADDPAAAARAWEKLQTRGPAPVDLARAWMARAALNLSQDHPREALIEVDSAMQADRSTPEVFLWMATVQVAGQNGIAASKALREAIVSIDGRHARRRAYGGALPVPADVPALRAGLTALLTGDPARADDLAVSTAVLDWLEGDLDAARASLAPLVERGIDPDALALDARLLLAKGQAPGALARVNQALALRPKEVAWQLVRAEALLSIGKASEAEAAIAAARSGNVPVTSLQLVVGKVAARNGNTAAALVARRAAVAADPTDLVARRALRGATED